MLSPRERAFRKTTIIEVSVPQLILSLDTTQPTGSIALARDGRLLEEREIIATEGFSGIIYPEISALLERNSVKLPEIGAYAAAAGPGSFTGVRIGLTVAKGLAEMHGKQVVAVSNLRAIAFLAREKVPAPYCPIIDVRRGEVAAAVYGAELDMLMPPVSAEPPDITARAAQFGTVSYCGADAPAFFPGSTATSRCLAGAMALLASRDFDAGLGLDPAAADAEYVRRADIRMPTT